MERVEVMLFERETFSRHAEGFRIAESGFYWRPIEANGDPTDEWSGPYATQSAAYAAAEEKA